MLQTSLTDKTATYSIPHFQILSYLFSFGFATLVSFKNSYNCKFGLCGAFSLPKFICNAAWSVRHATHLLFLIIVMYACAMCNVPALLFICLMSLNLWKLPSSCSSVSFSNPPSYYENHTSICTANNFAVTSTGNYPKFNHQYMHVVVCVLIHLYTVTALCYNFGKPWHISSDCSDPIVRRY